MARRIRGLPFGRTSAKDHGVRGRATGWSVAALVLFGVLALAPGCGETAPSAPRIVKRTLAMLPANYRRGTLNASEDGSQLAWAVQDGPRFRLVWNGVTIGDYDEAKSLWLGRSSKRFVGWASRDGGGVLVSDGKEYPIGTARRNAWAVSRDERRWAFAYADPEGDAVIGAVGRRCARPPCRHRHAVAQRRWCARRVPGGRRRR